MYTLLVVFLSGCSSIDRIFSEDDSGDVYKSSAQGQLSNILEGKIVSIRTVDISGSKGLGATAGGVMGSVAGSSLSKAKGDKVVGGAVGAIVGSLIGGLIEKNITKTKAFEFIVKLTSGKKVAVIQDTSQSLRVGDDVFLIHSKDQTKIAKM